MKNILVLLFVFSLVFAARPLCTDDSPTVAKDLFEFFAGLDMQNGSSSVTSLALKRGITEQFDVGLAIPYAFGTDFKLDNLQVMLKHQLNNNTEILKDSSLSYIYSNLPREHYVYFIKSLVFNNFNIHLNIGYKNQLDTPDSFMQFLFAYEFPIIKDLDFCIDLISYKQTLKTLFGFRYALAENTKIDGAITIVNSDLSILPVISVGLTTTF